VVSDEMGVELFFLARTVSGSGAPRCFCEALPLSPFDLGDILSPDNSKKLNIFFSTLLGHCHTSAGDVLIITDNQAFSCLIIKVFDNQTVSSP
jgi:hypothetical protein